MTSVLDPGDQIDYFDPVNLPALQSLVGLTRFDLMGTDVTPPESALWIPPGHAEILSCSVFAGLP